MNDLLRMDYIGQAGGAGLYRSLVLDAFGVRPEAQADILSGSTVAWETPERSRGWYWDNVAVIPRPQQAEGSLHELSHVWFDGPQCSQSLKRILAFQVAVYGTMPNLIHWAVDCEPATLDFLKGYYDGIGAWLGMYDLDHIGVRPKVRLRELWGENVDISNIIVWEIFAGCVSYTMGKVNDGPRRLPRDMRWLFHSLFTGDVKATPYYLPDGVP